MNEYTTQSFTKMCLFWQSNPQSNTECESVYNVNGCAKVEFNFFYNF